MGGNYHLSQRNSRSTDMIQFGLGLPIGSILTPINLTMDKKATQ